MQTFERIVGDLYPSNDADFEEIALGLFRFQATENRVYRSFLTYLGVEVNAVRSVHDIPCLPVSFFKTQSVVTGEWVPEVVFTSSTTTGEGASHHAIASLASYLSHTRRIFEGVYGPLEKFHVLCLLPSYLDRTGSSLVAMANGFIKASGSPFSGFYLDNTDALMQQLEQLKGGDRNVLLLGVSFALLDLAERYDADLSHCILMETGGMKGRRHEIVREELHARICDAFRISTIHSEYGMTEMFSQAYSSGSGRFTLPPSLRVIIRQINDPFEREHRSAGVINVIDLGNAHSCAFIETQDLGRITQDGHLEVLGRIDNSDLRGCNLMAL